MSRQGPLENLKELSLTFSTRPEMTADEYVALFEDCPGIESLVVPWSSAQLEPTFLGRFIGQYCPKLRNVRPSGIRGDTVLSATILTSMTPHTLRTLRGHAVNLSRATLSAIIYRHSSNLRKILLSEYMPMTSALIQKILVQCPELEELSLYDHNTSVQPLTLADATAEPWASNKIKKLQLRIAIPDLFYLRQKKQRPYFDRLAAAGTTGKQQSLVWTDAEQGQLALLERLYSQIGKQTGLEVLDLVAVPGPTSVKGGAGQSFKFDVFPLMLSLGDSEAGYPGYLDLLRGLKRLRKLIGSFGMFSQDSVLTVGEKEVEWMARHWVSLQEAHFYTRRVTPRGCFLKLQERLPGVKIYNFN